MVRRSVALAIRYRPRTSAKSRARNSPSRVEAICLLEGTMRIVRRVAPRKPQAKNTRIGSSINSPPKRGTEPLGVFQVAIATSASQNSAPIVSAPTRRGLRRVNRSWMNRLKLASVSTLSGQKKRSDSTLPTKVLSALQRQQEQAQRPFEQVDDRRRIEPEQDDQRAERIQRQPLAPVQVGERAVLLVERPQHHALDGPQVVRGGDDHCGRADDRQRHVDGQRTQEDGELADEAAQAGQAERGEKGEPHQTRVLGDLLREPAEPLDVAVVRAVVDDARDEEEHRADEAVRP